MELLGRILYELKWQVFCLVEWLIRTASRVGRQPFLDSAASPWENLRLHREKTPRAARMPG
jgi:hypothetical protein